MRFDKNQHIWSKSHGWQARQRLLNLWVLSLCLVIKMSWRLALITFLFGVQSLCRCTNFTKKGKPIWYICVDIYKYNFQKSKLLRKKKQESFLGSTEIWTRIAGFRVLSANHYTMEPQTSWCVFPHFIFEKVRPKVDSEPKKLDRT